MTGSQLTIPDPWAAEWHRRYTPCNVAPGCPDHAAGRVHLEAGSMVACRDHLAGLLAEGLAVVITEL